MIRKYNSWVITKEGGFITVKRYEAQRVNESGKPIEGFHWAFTLKKCRELCDKRDKGEQIDSLYLHPLY